MSRYKLCIYIISMVLAVAVLSLGIEQPYCQTAAQENESLDAQLKARVEANRAANSRRITNAQRKEAAKRAKELYQSVQSRPASTTIDKTTAPMAKSMGMDMPMPGETPHYFGPEPNWAYSPLLKKFIDSLPGLGYENRNNLEQYIPIANPDTITYPGSDYYEIGLVQYSEKMHTDLPPTLLRGYVQLN
ncbi:MAG: hypothetical protein PHW62_07820, partial [Candidatus Ratteibacteria bacterium]|nr:hypothetical protein [Candidatus Ratteibacteria bacterium]